ncbi:PaaI family thioesterase [Streptomyces antnestii]|uniref:Acyl-coenzyme A thioesterase THEM4 n=1 Tax=Streptomyces antnestii TaxID=2494256 RepID=A0A437Q0P8_9ACTN|nr:PaaI family thioesterase [Streptomyces sp. San01]RVU28092.1 PaaI family thioesterase [Streptomyces sp. San01]
MSVDERERLVEATRALTYAVAVTDLPDEDLAAVSEAVDSLSRALRKQTRKRCVTESVTAVVESRPVVLDRYNPAMIPLEVRFPEDGTAAATVTLNAVHQGPTDSVHGGVSGLLMDNILGILVQSKGLLCVTGTLSLRYRALTPLDRPLELRAEIVDHSGRRVTVTGWIECGGVRTVEATGVFIEVPSR